MAFTISPYPIQQSPFDIAGSLAAGINMSLAQQQAAVQKANAATTNAQLPYAGQQALANLINQQNVNQWYGPKAQSDIGLQGAQAGNLSSESDERKFKMNNPGFYGSDAAKDAQALQILKDRLAKNANPTQNPQYANDAQPAQISTPLQQSLAQRMQMTTPNQQPGVQNPSDIASSIVNSVNPVPPARSMQSQASQQQADPNSQVGLMTRALNADIGKTEAMIPYYSQGGGRGSVGLKNIFAFKAQLANEHPEWNENQVNAATSAHLAGDTKMPDGTDLPPLSGQSAQMLNNIQLPNAPKALQTQYSSLDTLSKDLDNFDVNSLSEFTGFKGAAKLKLAQGQMAAGNPNVDPVARRALSTINQSIANMDMMRKAYGTSVVPDYVYSTVGKLANPNSSIWLDKKQVLQAFNDTKKLIHTNRDLLKYKIQHGVTAEMPDSNSSSSQSSPHSDISGMTDDQIKAELASLNNAK